MLDQLSYQYPDITNVRCIMSNIKKQVPNVSDELLRIKAENYFLPRSDKFGSLTGWHMGGKKMSIDQFVKKIKLEKIVLNKFRLYVRFIGKIMILWNNSKKYHI